MPPGVPHCSRCARLKGSSVCAAKGATLLEVRQAGGELCMCRLGCHTASCVILIAPRRFCWCSQNWRQSASHHVAPSFCEQRSGLGTGFHFSTMESQQGSSSPQGSHAHLQNLNEAHCQVQVDHIPKVKRQGHEQPNGKDVFAVEQGGDGGVGLGLHQLQNLQQAAAVSAGAVMQEGLSNMALAAESLLRLQSSTCSRTD